MAEFTLPWVSCATLHPPVVRCVLMHHNGTGCASNYSIRNTCHSKQPTCHKSLDNQGSAYNFCLFKHTCYRSSCLQLPLASRALASATSLRSFAILVFGKGANLQKESAKPIQLYPLQHHLVTFDSRFDHGVFHWTEFLSARCDHHHVQ